MIELLNVYEFKCSGSTPQYIAALDIREVFDMLLKSSEFNVPDIEYIRLTQQKIYV